MASRAVTVTDLKGDPQKAWSIKSREKPRASPGHVVVRMTLSPINPVDTKAITSFLAPRQGLESVIGSEGVGFVEEVGDGVKSVKVGQRVVPSFLKLFFTQGNGSWQEFVEVPEGEIYFVPDSVPDEVAAQAVINPWTVYGLLNDQAVPKGEYLLQNAAGSVLGRQVIQLAKYWGIKTINIVRRDDLKQELKELGADEVISSSTEDIVARVMEITGGKGAYGALDCIAGIQTRIIAKCVRNGGKLFIYGNMASPEREITIAIADVGRIKPQYWSFFEYATTDEKLREISAATGKLLEEKVIYPMEVRKVPLENFKEALLDDKKPGRGGKILLVIQS